MSRVTAFDRALGWLMTWVVAPLLVVGMVGGLVFLAYTATMMARERLLNEPAPIELPAKDWACTARRQAWVPEHRCGAKIFKTCGGYFHEACTQYTEVVK